MTAKDKALLAELEARVRSAHEEGCPIASATGRPDLVRVALRRWRSASRRLPRAPTFEARVEDLAKGLVAVDEVSDQPVGRLMTDYRWLAARLAAILRDPRDRPS